MTPRRQSGPAVKARERIRDLEAQVNMLHDQLNALVDWIAASDLASQVALARLFILMAPATDEEEWLRGLHEKLQDQVNRRDRPRDEKLSKRDLRFVSSENARYRVDALIDAIRVGLGRRS